MTNNEFNLWIEGFIALTSNDDINAKQVSIIQNHANLVASIEGHLTPKNSNFIALLKDKISKVELISSDEFKKCWELC